MLAHRGRRVGLSLAAAVLIAVTASAPSARTRSPTGTDTPPTR
jgi:hypothetical protein